MPADGDNISRQESITQFVKLYYLETTNVWKKILYRDAIA